MRKACFIFPFLFVLLLSTSAYAEEQRAISDSASLTFKDTTACCYVYLEANSTRSNISATIKLWSGSQLIGTWEKNATGYITFSQNVSVEKGKTYKLTVSYTIDGQLKPLLSASGTC